MLAARPLFIKQKKSFTEGDRKPWQRIGNRQCRRAEIVSAMFRDPCLRCACQFITNRRNVHFGSGEPDGFIF